MKARLSVHSQAHIGNSSHMLGRKFAAFDFSRCSIVAPTDRPARIVQPNNSPVLGIVSICHVFQYTGHDATNGKVRQRDFTPMLTSKPKKGSPYDHFDLCRTSLGNNALPLAQMHWDAFVPISHTTLRQTYIY